MASKAAKIQSHFYCPHRRRLIGPLPSCYVLMQGEFLCETHGSVDFSSLLLHACLHATRRLSVNHGETFEKYKQT